MLEIIINVGIVVLGLGLMAFLAWAVDKKDEMYDDLEYGDNEEL